MNVAAILAKFDADMAELAAEQGIAVDEARRRFAASWNAALREAMLGRPH